MRGFLVGIIGLLLAVLFGRMWWEEKHRSKPQLPPSFLQEQLVGQRFVPVTERFSKVLAVCLPGVINRSYLMGWTATANYSLDLEALEIAMSNSEPPVITVEAPALELLNGGDNIIGAEDHFWFPRRPAPRKHYEGEKARAHEIAIAAALFRLQNNPELKEEAADQLRGLLAGLLLGSGVAIERIDIRIADFDGPIDLPDNPPLCEDQPLGGQPIELDRKLTEAEAEPSAPPAPGEGEEGPLKLEEGRWAEWLAGPSPSLASDVSG